jgi:hypothetical protein
MTWTGYTSISNKEISDVRVTQDIYSRKHGEETTKTPKRVSNEGFEGDKRTMGDISGT